MKRFSVTFLILILFLFSQEALSAVKQHVYKEGFKIRVNHSKWKISTFPSTTFGVAFTAYPKGKNRVRYFAVNVKPTVSKTNIRNLCSQNKMFIEKMSRDKVKASIRKALKTQVCYINYLKKRTEQYIFKTKKNYIVILTIENKSTKSKSGNKIFKLFSLK